MPLARASLFRIPGQRRRAAAALRHRPVVETLECRQLLSVATGTWTQLTNLDPAGTGTMFLLPDGGVMIQGSGVSNQWERLSPDASGSYINGSFSALAPMHLQRLYYASNVLAGDQVYVIGGEYTGPPVQRTLSTAAEMYNITANNWVGLPPIQDATGQLGDSSSVVLAGGQILIGPKYETTSYLYNLKTRTFAQTGSRLRNDINDEETWVKLPDGSILSYDVWASIANGSGSAQRYIPSQGAWLDAGAVPILLSTAANGHEMGPGLLLPDGRVFQVGGNGNTALYTPSTNTWVAGPGLPGGYASDDAPGVILPNGHVIFTADQPLYNAPAGLFDFDPTANTITQISVPDTLTNELNAIPAFATRMLVLPSGQLLLNLSGNDLWAFTPDTGANAAWQPVINSVRYNSNFVFQLRGQQLNGLSVGSSYGDDAGMDENYPIVQLTSTGGQVYYARTSNWSSVGVQKGTATVTTNFVLPSGMPAGTYSLTVIANGIASSPVSITISAGQIPPGGASVAGPAFAIVAGSHGSVSGPVTAIPAGPARHESDAGTQHLGGIGVVGDVATARAGRAGLRAIAGHHEVDALRDLKGLDAAFETWAVGPVAWTEEAVKADGGI
jgi:hypothetical protein